MRTAIFLTGLGLGLLSAQTADVRAEAALRRVNRQFFIENRGQWHPDVLYLWCTGGMDAWITRDGVVYDFYRYREATVHSPLAVREPALPKRKFDDTPRERYGHVVRLRHIGGSRTPHPVGLERQPGYYNYFIGSDPSRWASEVPFYGEVRVEEIYPGIHQRWYVESGRLRYDYIVMPGADAGQIQLLVEGADAVRAAGDKLLLGTRFGGVEQAQLYAYQAGETGKVAIPAQWIVEGAVVRFAVGAYDHSQPLIIDPLVWSTLIGGGHEERPYALVVDESEAVYIAGGTRSHDFPTTTGSYDQTFDDGGWDAFVMKIDASGSVLAWSTFLGGNEWDEAYALAVDSEGAVYVTGETESPSFPVTIGSYDWTHNGYSDAFITKLNAGGSALVWSTFLGGSSSDAARALAVDGSGVVYVAGYTFSTFFPTTRDSYDSTHNGYLDAFVTKLNASGSVLVWSTFLGGSGDDRAFALFVDTNGAVYVAGRTLSSNFPTTAGSYDQTHNGGQDVFVTKLTANGSALVWSTLLGGDSSDVPSALAVDGSGAVYVTGYTMSSNFPTTANSYDRTFAGGNCGSSVCPDAFVTKIDTGGNMLVWSTFLGGGVREEARALVVDENGEVYVAGMTTSPDFPTTAGAYQGNLRFGDAFITKLNSRGNALIWSTFFGGNGRDEATALAVDRRGAVYIAGETIASDFPTTVGSYDQTFNGLLDAFVAKFRLPSSVSVSHASIDGSWQVYPNPTAGSIFIRHDFARPIGFELLDWMGRALQRWSVPADGYHVIVDLPAGIYLIRETESGTTQRLIITE